MIPTIKKAGLYIINRSPFGIPIRLLRYLALAKKNNGARRGNIALFHIGRCGSTVLSDLLKQNSKINWVDEPFEKIPPAYRYTKNKRAEYLLKNLLYKSNSEFWGFDFKFLPEQHLNQNAARMPLEKFITLLKELGFTHFIVLHRNNLLKVAASITIGKTTGVWYSMEKPEINRIHLNPKRFTSYEKTTTLIDFFESIQQNYCCINELLSGEKTLNLIYENDIQENPIEAYKKVEAFLGIEHEPANVRLIKQNPQSLQETLSNFDEISDLLIDTPYGWMLRD